MTCYRYTFCWIIFVLSFKPLHNSTPTCLFICLLSCPSSFSALLTASLDPPTKMTFFHAATTLPLLVMLFGWHCQENSQQTRWWVGLGFYNIESVYILSVPSPHNLMSFVFQDGKLLGSEVTSTSVFLQCLAQRDFNPYCKAFSLPHEK